MKTNDKNEVFIITALLDQKLAELKKLEEEKQEILTLAQNEKNHTNDLSLKMTKSLQKYETLVNEIKELKQQAKKLS